MPRPSLAVRSREALPTLGAAVGLLLASGAFFIGLRPLSDNSFFTHLATGRVILDTGSIPSVDPYTFTANGDPWVVQSWLASWLYATVERVGGADGLRLLMGCTFAALTMIAWLLLRGADGVVARLGLGALFVAVGGELWAERPLMLGLVAFGCTMLAVEGRLDRRWLVPIGWVWVNVHGSFPLGIVVVVAAAIGARLDGQRPTRELTVLRWLATGIAVGAVGPLGPRVLVFPFELLERRAVLSNVIEWRAPTFDMFSQRMFLLQLFLAIVLLARRPSYRAGLVLAVFTVAALLGARNLSVASMALLPAMAASVADLGGLKSRQRGRSALVLSGLTLIVVLVAGSDRLRTPGYSLVGHPIDALAYLEATQVVAEDHPLAAPDTVGNVQELLYGPRGHVFYDDRFDLFPEAVSADHLQLVQGGPGVRSALAEHGIELVLWERAAALSQRLLADPAWRLLYTDDRWLVLCQRGVDLGALAGRC